MTNAEIQKIVDDFAPYELRHITKAMTLLVEASSSLRSAALTRRDRVRLSPHGNEHAENTADCKHALAAINTTMWAVDACIKNVGKKKWK
jgi:hypothetical protein